MSVKILVAFYSLTGATAALADAVAEGARSVADASVELRRVPDLQRPAAVDRVEAVRLIWEELTRKYQPPSHVDLEWADAIILGTPTRYGNVCTELKAFIDSTGPLWNQGKLVGKVGAGFVSTSTPHGGQETTLHSIFVSMMHLGMVVVTPGYADPIIHRAGSPYGATAVTHGWERKPPTEDDLAAGRFLGRHVAEVTRHLVLGRLADASRATAGSA